MAQSMERTYWLISVPKANGGLKDVKNKLEKSKYASVSPFSLPELRIGKLEPFTRAPKRAQRREEKRREEKKRKKEKSLTGHPQERWTR